MSEIGIIPKSEDKSAIINFLQLNVSSSTTLNTKKNMENMDFVNSNFCI